MYRYILLAACIFVTTPIGNATEADWNDSFFGPSDVKLTPAETQLFEQAGLRITYIDPKAPAGSADIRLGDHIVAFDGRTVWDDPEYYLVQWWGTQHPMAPIALTLIRDHQIRTVTLKPVNARRVGFAIGQEREALDALLAEAKLTYDREQDPLSWRAWQQMPGRITAALLRWRQQQKGAVDFTWLRRLDEQYRALCRQDYAAAVHVAAFTAPTAELSAYTGLLSRIAKRCAHEELAPDAAALGTSPIALTLYYPWPLLVGPVAGPGVPADFATWIDKARLLPASNRHATDGSWVFGAPGAGNTSPDVEWYLGTLRCAVLDPNRHGGWPFRHVCLSTPEKRQAIAAELDALAGKQPVDPVIKAARINVEFLTVVKGGCTYDQLLAAITTASGKYTALSSESPFWACYGVTWMPNFLTMRNAQGCRSAVHDAFALLAPQLTPKPSPILEFLRARDVSQDFYLFGDAEHTTLRDSTVEIYQALTSRRTIKQIDESVAALGPQQGPAERRLLFAEYMRSRRTLLDQQDVAAGLSHLSGTGQGCGVLLDEIPGLLGWKRRAGCDLSFLNPLEDLLWPDARDFDLAATDAGLANIPWTDRKRATVAVEDLRLRIGGPIAALHLADACDAHGMADDATRMRAQVHDYFLGVIAYERDMQANEQAVAYTAWQGLMVCASTTATAPWASDFAAIRSRAKEPLWPCEHLCHAQALLAQGKQSQCMDELIASFQGTDAKHAEPFVGAFGVLRREPPMRAWLVQSLHDAGVLDEAARSRIIAAARPEHLTPETLALLKVEASALRGAANAAGETEAPDKVNPF